MSLISVSMSLFWLLLFIFPHVLFASTYRDVYKNILSWNIRSDYELIQYKNNIYRQHGGGGRGGDVIEGDENGDMGDVGDNKYPIKYLYNKSKYANDKTSEISSSNDNKYTFTRNNNRKNYKNNSKNKTEFYSTRGTRRGRGEGRGEREPRKMGQKRGTRGNRTRRIYNDRINNNHNR